MPKLPGPDLDDIDADLRDLGDPRGATSEELIGEPIVALSDELDLHTFLPKECADVVAEYIRAAQEAGMTCVRIGGITQRAITEVLGDYQPDHELAQELETWTSSVFDADVLEDIEPAKWRFVRLPMTGAGGLAALAGGWEGSDELVDTILELRRTPGRAAPEVE